MSISSITATRTCSESGFTSDLVPENTQEETPEHGSTGSTGLVLSRTDTRRRHAEKSCSSRSCSERHPNEPSHGGGSHEEREPGPKNFPASLLAKSFRFRFFKDPRFSYPDAVRLAPNLVEG